MACRGKVGTGFPSGRVEGKDLKSLRLADIV
jgi:hypothetical protein